MLIVLYILLASSNISYTQTFTTNGDAAPMGGDCYRLTEDLASQIGSIWYSDLIDISEPFDLKFDLYFGTKSSDGADGIVFVLQDVGNTAIGIQGNGIGFAGFSPSLGIEFDTYDNSSTIGNGDDTEDHIGIFRDGDTDHTGPNSLSSIAYALPPTPWPWSNPGNIEDGEYHNVRIHWDPNDNNLLEVYFDCSMRLSINYDILDSIFSGVSKVYWGFTSATGGLYNEHRTCVQINSITIDTVNICTGDGAILQAAGAGPGGSYTWSPNYNIDNISAQNPYVTPTVETTYYVSSTDVCGYTKNDSVKVFVYDPPVVNLGSDQSTCLGGTLTLDAGNPGSIYLWAPGGETTQTIDVSPVILTNYTVTVTNPGGCTGTDDINIDVGGSLTVDIGNDTAICEGQDLTITASGGVSYNWDEGSTTPSITVTPAASTSYSVTVTDAGGCTGTDIINVTIDPSPTADAGTDQSICFGESYNLTATGGSDYSWDNMLGAGASHTVSPIVTTVYHVTVSNGGICESVDSVTITVNPLPVADAGNDQTICSGTTSLTATGGASYLWGDGEVTATINVTPVSTTTYYVTVTDANNCTATDDVIVNVAGTLTPTIGNDTSICEGEAITLTATGGVSYVWDSGETTPDITVTPISATTYYVTASDGGSCTGTAQIVISVNNLPAITVTADQFVCEGETIDLTASGASNFYWSTTETTATISITPSITENYYVTITDANSCSANDSILVTVNTLPVADAGSDISVCGGPVTLTANGGASYLWDNSEITQSISVNPVITTTYYVTVTDVNGCTDTDDMVVSISGSLSPDAGPDEQICIGETIQLTATGGTNYLWDNGETTASINVTPVAITIYSVTVTDGTGCTGTDQVEVTILEPPVISITGDTEICTGESTDITATGGTTYLWSTTEIGSTITVTPVSTTSYTVTVVDVQGCSGTQSIIVTSNSLPVADAGNDMSICSGPVSITASGGTGYVWDNSETTATISVDPASTTTYTVTVTDINGCTDLDNVTITLSGTLQPSAGSDITICDGESTTISASGGVNYIWNNSATTSTINVSPSSTTTYTVTASDASGCSGTDDIIVTVANPPVIGITENHTICEGEFTTLTASGASIYLWNTYETSTSVVVSPLVHTIYSVEGYDTNGCVGYANVTVYVDSGFTTDAGEDINICYGFSADLTATGGSSFLWSTSGTTQTINVSPLVTTTYYVTATNSNGCEAIDDVQVNVTSDLVIDLGPDQYICSGIEVTLEADSMGSFLWSTGDSTNAISITPHSTETYSVTVDIGGCQAQDEIIIIVNDPSIMPAIDLTHTDASCFGVTNGSVFSSVTNGQSPYTYSWNSGDSTATLQNIPGGSYTVIVTDAGLCTATASVTVNQPTTFSVSTSSSTEGVICNGETAILNVIANGGDSPFIYFWDSVETTQSINVSPTGTTEYYAWAVDSNGCRSETDIITIYTVPEIDIDILLDNYAVCPNDEVVINVLISGGTGGPYLLYVDGGLSNLPLLIYPEESGYVIIKVDDLCQSITDSAYIDVNDMPPLQVAIFDSTGCVPLTSTFMEISPDVGQSYLWEFSDDNTSVSIDKNTEYTFEASGTYDVTLTVTSDSGCVISETFSNVIDVYSMPEASFYHSPGETTTIDPTVVFQNFSSGANSYLWEYGDGYYSVKTQDDHTYPTVPGVYDILLTVRTDDGCIDSDSGQVTITEHPTFYAPTAFTPESSLQNQKFKLIINGIDPEHFMMAIYDRWGEVVFRTFNYELAWDGRINNNRMGSNGVYTWYAVFRHFDGQEHIESGPVTLIK